MLRSQDFLILIKLISLKRNHQIKSLYYSSASTNKTLYGDEASLSSFYETDLYYDVSIRNLGRSLGISKTEVSSGLKRCMESKLLAFSDLKLEGLINLNNFDWAVNAKALFNLIEYAFPYFYPIKQIGMTYGLKTGFAAPILTDRIISAGDIPYIWAAEIGNTFGLGIEPIYKSVSFASKQDEFVYSCFALIDAYRAGKPREKDIALEELQQLLLGK